MCIMATAHQPASTRLYNLPVKVGGKAGWRCLIYTNDLEVKPGRGKALMIVPFPNAPGNKDVTLVNVAATKTLRDAAKRQFKAFEVVPQSKYLNARGLESYGATDSMAKVVRVGNYNCSVVFSADDVITRIDWTQFTCPPDLYSRLAVMRDGGLMPENAAFVVAEAVESVQEDGFGVAYPVDSVFFPTCHESNASGVYDFDVCCYAFGGTLPEGIKRAEYDLNFGNDTRALKAAVDAGLPSVVPQTYAMGGFGRFRWGSAAKSSLTGNDMTLELDLSKIPSVSFAHLFGRLHNQNVWGSPAKAKPTKAIATIVPGRFDEELVRLVVSNGKYFPDASLRYAHMYPDGRPLTVSCDSCGQRNIDRCFAYSNNVDVCITCAARLGPMGTGAAGAGASSRSAVLPTRPSAEATPSFAESPRAMPLIQPVMPPPDDSYIDDLLERFAAAPEMFSKDRPFHRGRMSGYITSNF